ncbi:zinc finger protein ZFPM2-like [Salvelinus alpinus]
MSRRKQSNPRQFKREEDGGQSKSQDDGHSGKSEVRLQKDEEWDGPRELEILYDGTEQRTRFRQALPVGTTWGPFEGKIEMTTAGSDMSALSPKQPVPVVLTGGPRWLQDVTWLAAEDGKSNCVVYSIAFHRDAGKPLDGGPFLIYTGNLSVENPAALQFLTHTSVPGTYYHTPFKG